jgi:PAS domain S-box-containing protein
MPLVNAILLALLELWLVALLLMVAHRLSPRMGLAPLLVILGGLAGAMQFTILGAINVSLLGQVVVLYPAYFLFLPLLLFGLLLVYIMEGTVHARAALLGAMVVAFLAALIQIVPMPDLTISWIKVQPAGLIGGVGFRTLFSSTLALAIDLLALVLVYQWISNLQVRYPSRLAAGLALLITLFCDAVLFSLFSYGGEAVFWSQLLLNLAGKTIAALTLAPLLVYYIYNVSRALPESAATTPRPIFDIFSTSVQLEARMRYHHSLLQTLLQINEVIARSSDLQTLLDKACQLLVANRDYRLVWIGLSGSDRLVVHAGDDVTDFEPLIVTADGSFIEQAPKGLEQRSKRTLVVRDIARYPTQAAWREAALQRGYSSLVAFPLHYSEQYLGVLIVFAGRINVFDREEVNLLEELADDLANAITNLKARQQQSTLYTAADTMLDGLLLTDLKGNIRYANPAVAAMMAMAEEEFIGRSVGSFFSAEIAQEISQAYSGVLLERGILIAEWELRTAEDELIVLAVRASMVYDASNQPFQVVIGVRDITERSHYERQLLTLNRLTTELVQIHEKPDLMDHILTAVEDLLQAWASTIYLIGPDGETITDFVRRNLSDEYVRRIARGDKGLPSDTVQQTHKPAYVRDTLDDPVYQERVHFMAEYGVRALLVLPILYRDQVLGVLVIYFNQPHEFVEEEVQLGLTLAYTIAIAIQNIRLYQGEHSQRQLAEALAQAAASLNRFLNLDDVLDQILEQTLRVADSLSSNILLIDGDYARLVRRKGYDLMPEHLRASKDFTFPLTTPTLRYMLNTGQPVLITDTANDPNWFPTEGSVWIRSYAAAPLRMGGKTVGFLNVDSDQPGFFTQETTYRLQALADYAAIAIHNAQTYEDSRRQADELSTLIEAAATVSVSLDVSRVLTLLSEQMARLVGVEGCMVSDYDPANHWVSILAYKFNSPLYFEPSFARPYDLNEYPVTRRVVEEGITVQLHLNDPNIDPAEAELMRLTKIGTLLMVPLVLGEQTIGLLELETHDLERVFTEREIALVQTLGSHAANAIQNARLYAQLQQYANELEDRVRERTIELQSAKERIEAILASVPDAVFVLDEHQQSIHANQAGEALMSQAKQQGLELFQEDFLMQLKSGRLPSEKAVLELQGRAYQALASQLPIDQEQTGLVVVFRDVTRFRELDQMKTRFVSDVSHELRTPLTNIMLYLDLLSGLEDLRKGEGYLATLHREAQRLGDLIEDLLTISRLEAGRVKIYIKPLDVNQMVGDLVSDRFMLASSHDLTLKFQPAQDLPPASADASLLNQALSNLLTNAVNYTPAGGNVTLSTCLAQEDGSSWVKINVADSGVGIPAQELGLVFDRFFRGSASQQTGASGTGLGLSIVREIVTRVGGRISVQSQEGAGSTFTIWLQAVL